MAQCHTVTGVHWWNSRAWYNYSIPQSCYTTWNATTTTSPCGNPAWSLGDQGSASYTFTVGSQVLDSTKWKAVTRVYFDDPNNSSANWVSFGINVHHTNNTVTQYLFVSHSGTQGDITGCAVSSGTFTANTGDQVEVVIGAAKGVTSSGTPTIIVEAPSITSNNF
jgi:hypothetical protein